MQQSEKSGTGLLPRLCVQITQGEFVIAIEHHHRDVEGGVNQDLWVWFLFLDIQYRVAQSGEGISNFCPMLLAFAN